MNNRPVRARDEHRTSELDDLDARAARARLVQFLRADVPSNLGGLVFLLAAYLFGGRNAYMLVLASAVALNALLCAWALRRARAGEVVRPVTVVCVGLWMLAITIALLAPAGFPIVVLLVLLPLVLVLPYVSKERLLSFCIAATIVVFGCAALSQFQDASHLTSHISAWVVTVVLVALVPFVFAFTCFTLWQHSTRLSTALRNEREANLALRDSERVLELKVEQRTRELGEARDAALAADAAKYAFLATMSHEIRTPLNAVIGMSSLMLDTPLSREQAGFAQTIRVSGEALLAVINDVLDFSKIEAGRLELEMRPFEVRATVEDAVDVVAPSAAAKGIEFACDISDDVPEGIVGDANRFRQVLLNLMNNAVKFTLEGEVVITIRVDAADLNDEVLLHVTVRDTGLGIRAERIEELFESFTQLDASTTRQYGGTGLGLAISRRLTELMSGELWAESEGPGRGSTFHLRLPVQVAALPASRRRTGLTDALNEHRVLVVDDNATNRRLLELQTQSWGMQTRDTSDPLEALTWMERGDPFDVAILDMHMPKMDGLTLARTVRRRRPQLPILILTSLGKIDHVEPSDDFAFLTKPVKPSHLFDMLAELLDSSEGAADLQTAATTVATDAVGMFDAEMATRHPLRLLLAEDNELNQQMALTMLARLGYDADLAENGSEAIVALGIAEYDAVLMDVQMPVMDGLEAARRICALWPRDRRPRLIAITANAVAGDREACLAAGMDHYLAKPIRVPELIAALEGVHSGPPSGLDRNSRTQRLRQEDSIVLDRLRQVAGDDDGAVKRLLEIFLRDGAGLLDQIVVHRGSGDLEAFTRCAHMLKANAASLGADALAADCRELEAAGRRGDVHDTDALVTHAEVELSMLVAEIEALREDLG